MDPKTSDELFEYLNRLDIQVKTIFHEPLYTVADQQKLRGPLGGGYTKNLFIKDKKDNFFLLTVEQDAVVDLKTIHHIIGAESKVSFGKPEAMLALLGVTPGAVTAFAPINDTGNKVRVFLDADLMKHSHINCHPLINTATTSIAALDLLKFLDATGHRAHVLNLCG